MSASPDAFIPLRPHGLPGRLRILWPPGRPRFQLLQDRARLLSADMSRLPCPPGDTPLQRSRKTSARAGWRGRPADREGCGHAETMCAGPEERFDTLEASGRLENSLPTLLKRGPCQYHHQTKFRETENKESKIRPPDGKMSSV